MVLAEIEIRHSRAIAPTRRVAMGELFLPTDEPPGAGGLLLAGILGGFARLLDEETREQLDRLLWDIESGARVAQPRMRYRFQSDVHGLDRSRHRLVKVGQATGLELDDHGAALPQVLGAVYAASHLTLKARPQVFRLLRRATRWEGEPDERLLAYLGSDEASFRPPEARGDERWALETLGFARKSEPPRSDILARFRLLVRDAHPDHGADAAGAGERISDLQEAKRILLGAGG
ncbi:MAG TPA: hypothetical protein VM264_05505 [Acidimicrobiales bacterium]|nr:hypothetical protein [Acidimicrobiales bacterium]